MAKHSKEDNEKYGKDGHGEEPENRSSGSQRVVDTWFTDWPPTDTDKPK
jgi:hypothetical protein